MINTFLDQVETTHVQSLENTLFNIKDCGGWVFSQTA